MLQLFVLGIALLISLGLASSLERRTFNLEEI